MSEIGELSTIIGEALEQQHARIDKLEKLLIKTGGDLLALNTMIAISSNYIDLQKEIRQYMIKEQPEMVKKLLGE